MPIYEFECEYNHVTEHYFGINNCPKAVVCNHFISELSICNLIAKKIWSLPSYPSHGKPTIVFRNPQTNEVEVATYEHQQAPTGFIKEELKTPLERSKFEKEQAQAQRIEDEYKTEERRYAVDFARKKRHDDLNAKMSSITSKAENPAAAEGLLKAAMERTRKKKIPEKRTDMKLAVNHTDRSNLDKG